MKTHYQTLLYVYVGIKHAFEALFKSHKKLYTIKIIRNSLNKSWGLGGIRFKKTSKKANRQTIKATMLNVGNRNRLKLSRWFSNTLWDKYSIKDIVAV